jgi:hypothetical protein
MYVCVYIVLFGVHYTIHCIYSFIPRLPCYIEYAWLKENGVTEWGFGALSLNAQLIMPHFQIILETEKLLCKSY